MTPQNQSLSEAFAARRPGSARLHRRALEVFPSGVTHDSRYMEPFPIYVARAEGPRKWDVDGNEYVDYFGGHGALLLGHNHPVVTAAAAEQLTKGTHYGACHELEIEWGELVQRLVPSAERVKFVSSGTEATMMALRLARAFTGRDKIVKIQGHFHGWHDYATIAMSPPYDEPVSRGIPKATASTVIGVPPSDVDALRAAFEADPDIAGVILIAGGMGTEYLRKVNEVTHAHGGVVIYDEVVTGFRYAPGGAQQHYGVTPDITTLAKILAGGLPGGAIGAKKEILDLFEFRPDAKWLRYGRINHPGTFNANPLSAAAGVACLKIVGTGEPQVKAAATASAIRAGFNEALRRQGVSGEAGGETSMLGVKLGEPKVAARDLTYRFRAAMQMGGADPSGLSLIVSATHTDADVDRTVRAFDSALQMLRADGAIS